MTLKTLRGAGNTLKSNFIVYISPMYYILYSVFPYKQIFIDIRNKNTIMIDEDYLQAMCPYRIYKVEGRYLQHWFDSDEVIDITDTEEVKRAVLCSL